MRHVPIMNVMLARIPRLYSDSAGRTTWFLRKAAASSLEHHLVCDVVRSVVACWIATPRTPPLWQRVFFLVNCLVLRSLLASVRRGVVNTFRCRTESIVWLSYESLDRSNFLIAKLRERYTGSTLYHEKGSSVGAFNSVSIANPQIVLGLNFFAGTQEYNSSDFLLLDDILVSPCSAPDAGRPLTDDEFRDALQHYNSLYPTRSPEQSQSAARIIIDTWPRTSDNADSISSNVFRHLHELLGGTLVVATNFGFSDLYPNGIGGEQSTFWDDGRRIAELVFDSARPESELNQLLGLKRSERILSSDGATIDGSHFNDDLLGVQLVARQH